MHVSILKKYLGPVPPVSIVPPVATEGGQPTPHAIIAEHTISVDNIPKYEVLVEWQGLATRKQPGKTGTCW